MFWESLNWVSSSYALECCKKFLLFSSETRFRPVDFTLTLSACQALTVPMRTPTTRLGHLLTPAPRSSGARFLMRRWAGSWSGRIITRWSTPQSPSWLGPGGRTLRSGEPGVTCPQGVCFKLLFVPWEIIFIHAGCCYKSVFTSP